MHSFTIRLCGEIIFCASVCPLRREGNTCAWSFKMSHVFSWHSHTSHRAQAHYLRVCYEAFSSVHLTKQSLGVLSCKHLCSAWLQVVQAQALKELEFNGWYICYLFVWWWIDQNDVLRNCQRVSLEWSQISWQSLAARSNWLNAQEVDYKSFYKENQDWRIF